MLNVHKWHNCKCCALRGSLNLMAPICELVLFIVTAILSENTWYVLQFDTSQFIRFSASSVHFRMTLVYLWFWIPTKQPNKDSTEALMRKASDCSGRFQRGLGIIYITVGFLSAFSFWKFLPKFYWIFNCDFWIRPLCTFTDRISQKHEDDTSWWMQ